MNIRSLLLMGALVSVASAQTSIGDVLSEQKINDRTTVGLGLVDGDMFGSSAAALDDLDGNGVGDIAVGVSEDFGVGRVLVLLLEADGTVASQAEIGVATGLPLDAGDAFGTSVAALGDLDGDGVTELAVGAVSDDDGGSGRGAVWILFLDTDGSVKGTQKISATTGGFGGVLSDIDSFGSALAALGDLDGDGVVDLAVGAHFDDDAAANGGAVWILFLDVDGTVKSEAKISGPAAGLDAGDRFGGSLACLGDLDGDGVVDLAVGAHLDDDAGGGAGAVWVLFLASDGSVRAEQKISQLAGGPSALDQFGWSVAAPGDFDGDGHVDLAVGAINAVDGGHNNTGAVWLLYLAPDGQVLSEHLINGSNGNFGGQLQPSDNFGSALAAVGDLDGDGVGDLVAGARWDSETGPRRGAVWVLFLNAGTWIDAGGAVAGTIGEPILTGLGTLAANDPATLTLTGALPGSTTWLVLGVSLLNQPFKGGTLVPQPDVVIAGLPIDGIGELALSFDWPAGIPPDSTLWFQHWIVDAGAVQGLAASNGLAVTTP